MGDTVDGGNPANQLICSFAHYLQGFYASKRWLCGISEPSTVCTNLRIPQTLWEQMTHSSRHPENTNQTLQQRLTNTSSGVYISVKLLGARFFLVAAKLQREQCTAPSRLSSPVIWGSFLRIPVWEDWGTLGKIRGNHHHHEFLNPWRRL